MNTRREFLCKTILASTGAAMVGCVTGKADGIDANLSVWLSDIHIVPDDPKYYTAFLHTRTELTRRIDEILSMRPLPAHVVTFGDLAFNHGEPSCYAFVVKEFQRLQAVGIKVVHGMGNHDRRNTFAQAFPETQTEVPGRFVSVVNLGYADLILLDSLRGKDGEVAGPVNGELNEAQQQWLMKVLPHWKRPVFVGAHHPAHELSVGNKRMVTFLKECPNVVGWINGHDHVWRKECLVGWWASNEDSIRSLTLPSTGLWGDIGLVTFRTEPNRAIASLDQKAYWFNNGPRPGEAIPELWTEIVEENRGQYCVFPFQRLLRKKWSSS